MKKTFLILFLSLLLNTESFANIDKIKIELEGCGKIKSTGRDRVKDYYYLYFENKSSTTYDITNVVFYTKDNQRMSSSIHLKTIKAFHKGSLRLKKSDMLHELVGLIYIYCVEKG